MVKLRIERFQFLGIPPKGEPERLTNTLSNRVKFPISRDPPEGGTANQILARNQSACFQFLGIPPKGEHRLELNRLVLSMQRLFPISRDPPEGGTLDDGEGGGRFCGFQFLGIPPKGELSMLPSILGVP